jgi:RNA polymerase sigma factor (sigma-70 family)
MVQADDGGARPRIFHFSFSCNNAAGRAFFDRQAKETFMTSTDPHGLRPLLKKALEGGDEAVCAWNTFFEGIRRLLHAELQKVGGPNEAAVLDHSSLVQSTLRRVLERIEGQFPDGADSLGRFLGWVKKIVRNRRLEELRSLHRRRTKVTGPPPEPVADPRPPSNRREQVSVELAAGLARLSEKKRQVVELFWFERLPDVEIGARLGCSAGAVKVLRCRALRELRSPNLLSLLEEQP